MTCSSIAWRLETLRPSASTEMKETSAIPIMSAAAVDAVRPGLRTVFWLPVRAATRSGITLGNSVGHSGRHELASDRTHITSTTSGTARFATPSGRSSAATNAERTPRC